MNWWSTPTPNCGHCGRFCQPADAYAPWGGCADQEPPDDILLCRTCARTVYAQVFAQALRHGIEPYDARPWWHPPSVYRDARAHVRALWKRGIHLRPVRHERVRYTAGRDTDDGPFLVEEFCACGWRTGRRTAGGPWPPDVDYLMAGRLIREHVRECS